MLRNRYGVILECMGLSLALGLSACAPVHTDSSLIHHEAHSQNLTDPDFSHPLQSHEEIAQQTGEALERFSKCSSRAWPDSDWSHQEALFVVEGSTRLERQAWLWSAGRGVHAVDPGLIPDYAFTSRYSFVSREDTKVIALNLPADLSSQDGEYWRHTETSFRQVAHESFHHFEQRLWPALNIMRGTLYPLKAEPRIQRSMLYQRLSEGLQAQNGVDVLRAFRKAAFWYQEWKRVYPLEAAIQIDRIEGSAVYFESLAWALTKMGCEASDEQILNSILPRLQKANLAADLTLEAYQIGGLATFALRLLEVDNWPERLKMGETPLEILFQKIPPLKDEADQSISQYRESLTSEVNHIISPLIEPSLDLIQNGNFVYLDYDSQLGPANFTPMIYALPEKSFPNSLLPMFSGMKIKGPRGEFQTSRGAVYSHLANGILSPCEKQSSVVLLIDPNWIQVTGDQVTLNSQTVRGRFTADWRADAKGQRWLCFH